MKNKSNLSQRDKYLRSKFERTEEEYNTVLASQGGVCRICRTPPGSRSLHLDHDHTIASRKINSEKINGQWSAWPSGEMMSDSPLNFIEKAKTKPAALAKVRKRLKRLSSRGILCWKCNTGLKKWQDNAMWLLEASKYITRYGSFIVGSDRKGNGFTV